MEIIPNVHLVPGMKGANIDLLLGDPLTLVHTGMVDSEEKSPTRDRLATFDQSTIAPSQRGRTQ